MATCLLYHINYLSSLQPKYIKDFIVPIFSIWPVLRSILHKINPDIHNFLTYLGIYKSLFFSKNGPPNNSSLPIFSLLIYKEPI